MALTAVATIKKGFDGDYMWAQVGTGPDRRNPARYYLSPTEGGGEPPGRWWGPAARFLGFADGQEVERPPYDALMVGHCDPRTGELLGKAPGGGRKAAEIYAALLAAEPHATADRQHELREEAGRQARQSPLYFDLTISWSKSISVFHASVGENIRLARLAGEMPAEARWTAELTAINEMMYAAVTEAFVYFQEQAGYGRTGHHGRRVEGRDTGQWHEAALAVTQWLQHTSRDGDMQMHLHNQIAHVARRWVDGKWSSPDSLGYNEFIGAVAQRAALHFESAMTRRYGLDWTPRDDGFGCEIAGVDGAVMREFSSRREAIKPATKELAREYEIQHGRKPSQATLTKLARIAGNNTRKHKKEGALDHDVLRAGWATQLRENHGIELRGIACTVSSLREDGTRATEGAHADRAKPREMSRTAQTRAIQAALSAAQDEKSAWTRADLIKHLGRVMPPSARRMDAAETGPLLDRLADEAISGAVEQVICLEADTYPAPPPSLIRKDGRSVYQRHGGTRYATRVQLSLEERLVSAALAQRAPALDPAVVAGMLGTDVSTLADALTTRAQDNRAALPSGLRMDQAAALHHALTSPRTVSVIVGPAGSGKTRVLAEAARMWAEQGGAVVGVTPSQASRNVLRNAGVARVHNFAKFLGHLPKAREALGKMNLAPGTLVLIDEASMLSTPDMEAIVTYAAERGCKVLPAGDQEQLTAVQAGGGLMLLTRRGEFAQLAEPVRFVAEWEREASLRLRAGDLSVLSEYDQHARIRGGTPEEALDQAAAAYVAGYLAGSDVLLMVADWERCRELSRRIRDDLIHLGKVSDGDETPLREGAKASVGDLIICRKNDHGVKAGEPGRTLANGDTLIIDGIAKFPAAPDQVTVRRLLDCDPQTGERRYSAPFVYDKCKKYADLAYSVTAHSAQGRTVRDGVTVITGTEDRQKLYVAMTRGTHSNTAYVFSEIPKVADPRPGTRAAPEIRRQEIIRRQREGLPALPADDEDETPARRKARLDRERSGLAVLADVIGRDGAQQSALEIERAELSNADHLAVLNAQWLGETGPAIAARYEVMLRAALPVPEVLPHTARWLWNTLQAAEMAGMDPAEALTRAVEAGPMTNARDVVAVIGSRVQDQTAAMVPLPVQSWADQTETLMPYVAEDKREYVAKLAAAMDARKVREGEHTTDTVPVWVVSALGDVPQDEGERSEWTARAADIVAYRKLYGYEDAVQAIGPEPKADTPDKRTAWHTAFRGMAPVDGPDVRGLPDGTLLHMRDTYPTETAWAPRYVADELRQVRAGAADAGWAAIRADAEAEIARTRREDEIAARHEVHANSARAMAQVYRQHEATFAATMEDYEEHARVTEQARHLAAAADSEIRRRHPDQKFEPMRSAHPAGPTEAEQASLSWEHVRDLTRGTEGEETAEPADVPQWAPVRDQTEGQEAKAEPEAEVPEWAWVRELAGRRAEFREKLEQRQGVMVPSEDPDAEPEGEAWPNIVGRQRDAILQPPKPSIKPAAEVAEMARERAQAREVQRGRATAQPEVSQPEATE